MMPKRTAMLSALLFLVLASLCTAQIHPELAAFVQSKTSLPGYFPLYWDATSGRLWMLVDKWDTEFLYINSLSAGVGSNDIGLDRGQLGSHRIVLFRRVGPKVLLMQPNERYRAGSADPAERAAVEQSFAQAVLWGFKAEHIAGNQALIDVTDFALRDAHRVIPQLKDMNEGEFKVDATRSAIFLDRTRNFPKNTEVEALVTYVTEKEMGRHLQSVAPAEMEFSVRLHHSFVELPEPGYQTRSFDPRSGYGAVSYVDFAAPIEDPIEKRLLPRHRLQKKNPAAPRSEPVRPITYYLDRGAPEPIRSALLEGARWWNQAFGSAGYINAFRVELLPEGADPMDIRYNVIQWVHRSTRGWSYGSSVRDPRTGEILKGHVTLGSLRVRQLSAHEVGHTLGLAHNFAASLDGRASVMDYPHPYVALGEDNAVDLADAYATGMGEWDKVTIAFGYQHFPPGTDEAAALRKILDDAEARGLRYITDRDSRPEGGASPDGHLWDNGKDPSAELARLGRVRQTAINRFSENVLRPGEPYASLGEALVPIYLLHRYQVEAAAKVVGGVEYTYAIRPANGAPPQQPARPIAQPVARERQQAALSTLLETVSPAYLRVPDRVLNLIPPHPPGFARTRESFPARTGLTFDPLAAAEIAADHTLSFLLHPERAARLVQQAARQSGQLRLSEMIDQIFAATLRAAPATGLEAEIQRTVHNVLLYRLMVLTQSPAAPEQAKGIAYAKLAEAKAHFEKTDGLDADAKALATWAAERIRRFQTNPKDLALPKPQPAPPGQPIGCGEVAELAAPELGLH